LTKMLLQTLKDTASRHGAARVLIVSSDYHTYTFRVKPLDFDDLFMEKPGAYSGSQAYKNSKAMNILHCRKLARMLEGTGVYVNALHPGFIPTTGFFRGCMRCFFICCFSGFCCCCGSPHSAEAPVTCLTLPRACRPMKTKAVCTFMTAGRSRHQRKRRFLPTRTCCGSGARPSLPDEVFQRWIKIAEVASRPLIRCPSRQYIYD
ncbi:hypothetical protein BOX15_Mlig029257g1, partial [Macrostomum lignano]